MAVTAPADRTSAAPLVDGIPSAARLHVVTGKGGTGKTTAAAALALALADTGRKVLLVEVESRQAIAQLFDRPPMPYSEERIAGAARGGELFGLAIDPEQAMIEYLELFYGLKRSARGLKKMGAVDFVTTLAPGLRDVLLTGKVKESVVRTADGRPVYDAVVLDAPPTGRIERFLDATREVAKLTKMGPINKQSEGVIQLLHGPKTAVHIVTLLEEMPVQETIDAAAELAGHGFQLGAVIVNRARPALITPDQVRADGSIDPAVLAAGLRQAGVAAAHAPALAAEMADYAQRQRVQDENAARLDKLDLPRVELPDLNPPVAAGRAEGPRHLFRAAAGMSTPQRKPRPRPAPRADGDQPANQLDVAALVRDPATKVVVTCGSGGVGKTTTAAAMALIGAEAGRRTVVLTIDPARRLAQSMGLTELDNTPRPVTGVAGGQAVRDDAGHEAHVRRRRARALDAGAGRSRSSPIPSTSRCRPRSPGRRSTWRWRSWASSSPRTSGTSSSSTPRRRARRWTSSTPRTGSAASSTAG